MAEGDIVDKSSTGKMTQPRETSVSLNPLNLGQAISGLLAIPNPDATKPTAKRKKAPPPPKE